MDALESYLSAYPADVPENDSRLLREVAYERLKDALRHASLQPGEPLSENRISKALGISRTPGARSTANALPRRAGGNCAWPRCFCGFTFIS
ncbi:MAG: GntR family transcriptional regulator [Anaerolineae bacterium]|nr:GntR family transcriptional regulator [Anaerolineae bacterium]